MSRVAVLLVLVVLAAGACGDDGGMTGDATPTPTGGGTSQLEVEDIVTLLGADPDDAAAGMAAGDFNGDGDIDIVLGAAFGDGPGNTREDAGEVLLFLGPFERGETRDAAAGANDAVIYGDGPGDQAGRAVAAADVNGDSIDDIVIGVPFGDGLANEVEDAGEAVVIFGSAALGGTISTIDLRADHDILIAGAAAGALTAFSLASGDLNGDSYSDIVVGSFQADGSTGLAKAGSVHVVYGSDDPAPLVNTSLGEAAVSVYGPTEDAWLGETVNTGDFNGDGLDDLLLTAAFAPSLAGEDAGGRVYAILSPLPATVDLSTDSADYTVYGQGEGDQIGHSSATGDIDGDGLDDMLLGAVSSDGAGDAVNLAGEAVVVTAASLRLSVDVAAGEADAIAYGTAAIDRLGRSVALGDVNGDGLNDLIFGLPGADSRKPPIVDAGAIYLVYGGASLPALLDLAKDSAAYFGDTAGGQLANGIEGRPALITTDVDGDDRADILVSASDGGDVAGAGAAYVLFVAPR